MHIVYTVYLLVIVWPTRSSLLSVIVAPFPMRVIKFANTVKEIDHTHELEMLKYVIHVYKA